MSHLQTLHRSTAYYHTTVITIVDLSTAIMRVILFHIIKSCPRVLTQQGAKMKNLNENMYRHTIWVYLKHIIKHVNNVESCGESSSAAYIEIKKGNRYMDINNMVIYTWLSGWKGTITTTKIKNKRIKQNENWNKSNNASCEITSTPGFKWPRSIIYYKHHPKNNTHNTYVSYFSRYFCFSILLFFTNRAYSKMTRSLLLMNLLLNNRWSAHIN